MKVHWRPVFLTLTALPTAAAANTPTGEPLEPLARKYLETAEPPLGLPPADDDKTFKVAWKDGLAFETVDKAFKAKIGGRIQYDWAFFSEDIEKAGGTAASGASNFDFENATFFRRARLYLEATLYENIEFKAQYDFASSPTVFADVYVGYLGSPEFNIRAGQFKEPFSLEELTSSNYIAFMERALPNLSPARSTGVMLHGAPNDERVTYGLGIFKDEVATTGAAVGSSAHSITARVTGLPVHEDDGKTLVHLGVGASLRNPTAGGVEDMFDADFRPSISSTLSPTLIRNDAFAADKNVLLGAEAAAVVGPWWGQAEYMLNDVDANDGFSDATISGYYLATGYFLTGESRGYKKSTATFDKVKPKTIFGKDGGTGAIEVAVRYGTLEFEDLRRTGQTATFDDDLADITLGVNWYLNTNTRVMFNVVDFDVDAPSVQPNGLNEGGTAFMTRFQVFL